MRRLFIGSILLTALFCIGLVVYLEVDIKRFEESLPPTPTESSLPKTVGKETQASEGQISRIAQQTDLSTQKKVSETYDWRKHGHEHRHGEHKHEDLWGQDQASNSEKVNTHWLHITDPHERSEGFRANLIKQFGDVPAVDAVVEGWLNLWLKEPMDTDESLRFNIALNELWPSESTQATIARLQGVGESSTRRYQPSELFRNIRHQFPDLEPLVREHGFEQGVLRFAEQNPERALEFKWTFLQTDEVRKSFEDFPEETREFFKEIVAPE